MCRSLTLFVGLALLCRCAAADDAITPERVAAVKHATAFVRVQGATWKGTGSGFVVAANKDGVLLATNYHVVAGPDSDKRRTPGELVKSFKQVTVTVVFDGGTKGEVSAKAEVLAADPVNDLAVLRVTGLKAAPPVLPCGDAAKPVETMTVYTFGYPFGQALAVGKASPAITVGKASVSSLRADDDGELALVQIDGALNPGNSGGPMVDSKGKLVGVAVSRIRDGQGIGFAVPAAELDKLMKGRIGGLHLTAQKGADGKLAVRAEAGVLDPEGAVKGATLHYVVVPPKGAKPKAGEALDKHPDAKAVALKLDGGLATGELTVPGAGELVVQVTPDGGAAGSGRVASFPLFVPKSGDTVVLGGPSAGPGGAGAGEADPPAGWKEYTLPNKTFKAWLPDKAKAPSEKSSSLSKPPLRFTFNTVLAEAGDGLAYSVEQVLITPPRINEQAELSKLLRDVAVGDAPGTRVTRETDAKMGRFAGKEYLIERGGAATRARTFVIGSSLYLLRATGTKDQVDSADATLFLDSCRLQVITRPPDTGSPSGAAIAGGNSRETEFTDLVPEKGALVGFEFHFAKFGPNNLTKGVRGVYRVGDKESFGAWKGEAPGAGAETTKLVAKPGYAVGAVRARSQIALQGAQLTFMKLTDGKLDPKDKYESEWAGAKDGPGDAVTAGTGETPLGLAGRSNPFGITGIGLLYKEPAKKETPVPNQTVPNTNPNPNPNPNPTVKAADRGPRIHGSPFDPEFRDNAPAGGYLVGLEIGLGKAFNRDVVKAVRPVYRAGDKDVPGEQFGTDLANVTKLVAKPGYAVGAVTLRRTTSLNSVQVTFMKVADGKLDPKDSYESETLGTEAGGPVKVGGDGSRVEGILLKANAKDVTGLGLIYTDTNKPGLDGAWPKGVPTAIQGGGRDREFREAGPEGSVLAGVEVGVGRFFDTPVVKSVRPVFRAGDKDTAGAWYGPTDKETVKEVVKVVAKPGYAVGAITVKTGLGMDGVSVTFMKLTDGKLDPSDKYESEWVGGAGGAGKVTLGDGKLVIGLVGRARDDTVSGLGLLHPAPAK